MKLAPFYLISAALVGIGVTLYLSYFAFLNTVPGCAIGGCEAVLTSEYAKFFGVPLAYLGLVYYVYMLGLALLLVLEPNSRALAWAGLLYAGVGLLLSVYFEFYIQAYLIGAMCLYCGISAVVTLALFAIALWHVRSLR